MEPEQVREYHQLLAEVVPNLRHHAYVGARKVSHCFQYLVLPSFAPPIAWDVFRERQKHQPEKHILIRTCWRCDLDKEKLRTPVERLRHPYPLQPTIEVHELSAPSSELMRLAEDLGALAFPIGASSGVVGLDGVTFEVAIEQPPAHIALAAKCRLSWWFEPPAAWAGLDSVS